MSLSDDEIEIEEELTFDELYPEYEVNEEDMNIIYKKINKDENIDDLFSSKTKSSIKNIKNKKENSNKKMNLKDFYELNKKEPTSTWTSSRVDSKKVTIIKRCFNPRLPPYKTIKRDKKQILNFSEESFPQLK